MGINLLLFALLVLNKQFTFVYCVRRF
uniref:Uncharacterized protein n=1 Tax=Anguilla anguilla TaxID=7936 RepID=A0A0E9X9M5_ANGAN